MANLNHYNFRERADRAEFDDLVRRLLHGDAKHGPWTRADMAVAVFLPAAGPASLGAHALRAVATALKRGVRDGWAKVEGTGAWSRYLPAQRKLIKIKKTKQSAG